MKKAALRDLLRTFIAAITAILLAKGMSLAVHDSDITFALLFALGSIFWIAGMFYWEELDG